MFIKIDDKYINVIHIVSYEYDKEYERTIIHLSTNTGTISTKESIETIKDKLHDIYSMRIFHK